MLPRLRAFLPFLTSTSLAGSRTMVTKTPLEPTLPTSIAGKEHRQTLPKGGELETFYGANGCALCSPHFGSGEAGVLSMGAVSRVELRLASLPL